MLKVFFYCIAAVLVFGSCRSTGKMIHDRPPTYIPDDEALYKTIVAVDSLFFTAYNNCNMAVIDSMISPDLEFYHDKGGLSTSKKETLEATQRNICGKVRRELVPGSIEVYPIKDFGAIQIGLHRFYNLAEDPDKASRPGKFIHTWRLQQGRWQLHRVISLH